MHRIVRMIFAAKAGRIPGGAAQFAYKPIALFRLKNFSDDTEVVPPGKHLRL